MLRCRAMFNVESTEMLITLDNIEHAECILFNVQLISINANCVKRQEYHPDATCFPRANDTFVYCCWSITPSLFACKDITISTLQFQDADSS